MRGPTALVASFAVTALVVGGVVAARTWPTTDPAPAPRPAADPPPTTLASYGTAGVRVVRGPFCDRVSPTGIEHALGDVPADHEVWDNGDRVRLPDGSRDRVQEYGCRWTAADGSQAAAWVFVPPVTAAEARELRGMRPDEDCSRMDGQRLGRPSVAWECGTESGTEERYAGRLGDAWLTCTLARAGDRSGELDLRTSEWCVTVVEAARG